MSSTQSSSINKRYAIALPMLFLGMMIAFLGWNTQRAAAQDFPAISLDKAVQGGATEVVEGGTVTFTLSVKNEGTNTPLQNVVITDNGCALSGPTKTGGDTDDWLETGESWNYTCVTTAVADGELKNTATVSAQSASGQTVEDSASASITVLNAGVHVTKAVNAAQKMPVVQGETVVFDIVVRNTGTKNIDLSKVTVTDPLCTVAAKSGPLAPNASTTYSCSVAGVLDDVTNTVSVTAIDVDNASYSHSATAKTVTVLNPGLAFEKSASKATVTTGETVKWTFKLWNTGEITLTTTVDGIVDDKCSPITPASASIQLDPGAQKEFTCERSYSESDVPVSGTVENTATVATNYVAGINPGTGAVAAPSRTAKGSVTVLKPGLEVNKLPLTQQVAKDGTANFTITAKNTGQGDLTNVELEDLKCSTISPKSESGASDNKLNPGETWTWTCEVKTVAADFSNVAVVRTKDASGIARNGTATAYVDVVTPGINISKGTIENGVVTNPDNDLTVSYGMTATFSIKVTNKDVTALSNISVLDNQCPVQADDSNKDGYNDGDTNKNKKLDSTETWTYTCAKPDVQSDFENSASVSAVDVLGTTQSASSNKVKVNVLRPDLQLVKTPKLQIVEEGKTITWTLTITNVGQINLNAGSTTVTNFLIDPMCKTLTPTTVASSLLAPNDVWTFTCTADAAATFVSDEIENTATAIFKTAAGATIIDGDSADVEVVRNSLNLQKTPRSNTVLKGADAIFDFTVSVISRSGTPAQTLTDIMVEDALCPTGKAAPVLNGGYNTGDTNRDDKLQSTEVWSFSCTVPSVQANLTNTARASGKDANGRTVSDTDSSALRVVDAQMSVNKSTGTKIVNIGQDVTFDIEVSNSGANNLLIQSVVDAPSAGSCQGGNNLTLDSGDVNNDGKLNAGETWKYSCLIKGLQDNLENKVTVTAKDEVSGLSLERSDSENVTVLRPGANIQKLPDTQTVQRGGTAYFSILAQNTGAIALTGVDVQDGMCDGGDAVYTSGDNNGNNVLDPLETWVYECKISNVTNNLVNTASLTANGGISESDTASVVVPEEPTPTPTPPTPTPPTPTPPTPTPPTPTPTPEAGKLYVSSTSGGRLDDAARTRFADEDILEYDQDSGTWSVYFDGSDVGLRRVDIDGFAFGPNGELLMSFHAPVTIPGVGTVDDSDIVEFVPIQLGDNTIGTFNLYMDGSTRDLTSGGEDVDAIAFDADGNLVISTSGTSRIGGERYRDEDLLVWNGAAWELFIDGSNLALTGGSEDIAGAWIEGTDVYLTTVNRFAASSLNAIGGDGDDIFTCDLQAQGAATSCLFGAFFDGDVSGFRNENIDAFAMSGASVTSAAATKQIVDEAAVADFEVDLSEEGLDAEDEELDEFDLQESEDEADASFDINVWIPLIQK